MNQTAYEHLTIKNQDKVAEICLSRPDKANALNLKLWHEIRDAFSWADQNPQVRCIILKGEGNNFCAGIDFSLIKEISETVTQLSEGRKQEYLRDFIRDLQQCFTAIETCRKPVIAAIHGACFGGGIDLITACDIRYASDAASFCVKELDLAIVADVGTLQRLPRIVSEGVARELALTARTFDGLEAYRLGLVNKSYPDEASLFQKAYDTAVMIAKKSPLATRGTKQILNYSRDHSVTEGLEYVAMWNAAMLLSTDLQKALEGAALKKWPEFED